jgi:alginate O-acetyltransferase complex protein AlgI
VAAAGPVSAAGGRGAVTLPRSPMTFNSLPYALFLPIVVVGHWMLPAGGPLRGRPGIRWRQCWLLAASYVFYGAFDPRFALLLAFTTVVDYQVARRLDDGRERSEGGRRRLLATSVGVNLAVLGFFKYAGFFVDQGGALLEHLGMARATFGLHILLPYGISFYTFQSIGYTVDVYRRSLPACRRPVDFATFVAFFPQLVAGPISRAPRLLPQIEADRRRPGAGRVASGLGLILLGLVRKVVLADPLAPVVARAFGGVPDPSRATVVVGVLAFAVQIYGDFAGYSDMARGSARLLGIELVHNFDQPYLSASITEFWGRWHISLSTWLRDYLYVPLGGNRGGRRRTYRNLMLTMVLGGLWHGAAWTFVAWGALHGLYLCVERALGVAGRRSAPWPAWWQAPRVVLTFVLVSLAWVPFRAADGGQALGVLQGLGRPAGASLPGGQVALVVLLAAATLALDLAQRCVPQPAALVRRHPTLAGSLAGTAVVAVIVFSGGAPVPFIYFQF